mgnify:CR=1 FL=1
MKMNVHQLALCAMLTALALALSYLENMFPTALLIPLPGFKLGLANIVTVFALYYLGAAPAMVILLARCLLGAMFAGNASALLFSLIMILLHRVPALSIYGVSIAGAAGHNIGQVAAAVLTLGSPAAVAYLPILLVVSLFTGALTGFIAALLFAAMEKTKLGGLSYGTSTGK